MNIDSIFFILTLSISVVYRNENNYINCRILNMHRLTIDFSFLVRANNSICYVCLAAVVNLPNGLSVGYVVKQKGKSL